MKLKLIRNATLRLHYGGHLFIIDPFLADEQAKHAALTAKIVAREERLNGIVYEAFGLDAEEIRLIESSTKYPYGAV